MYSLVAKNNLYTTKRINNLLKMQTNHHLFYVQVGAFKNRKYALIIKNDLEKMNYSLKLKQRSVEMKSYFKLLIGPFESRGKARAIKNSLPLKYKSAFVWKDINN
jgi:cell division septation protein DedD